MASLWPTLRLAPACGPGVLQQALSLLQCSRTVSSALLVQPQLSPASQPNCSSHSSSIQHGMFQPMEPPACRLALEPDSSLTSNGRILQRGLHPTFQQHLPLQCPGSLPCHAPQHTATFKPAAPPRMQEVTHLRGSPPQHVCAHLAFSTAAAPAIGQNAAYHAGSACATVDGAQDPPKPTPSGRASLAEVQQVIKEVLGAEYCPKESAVSASEVQELPSLALVRIRVAELKDVFGTKAAARLLGSHLRVLNTGPAFTVRERLDVVAAECGCDMATALMLCTRHKGSAQLLRWSPPALQRAFATLRDCLGLQTEDEVHQMFVKNSRILLFSPDLVLERHAALGPLLGLDSTELTQLLQRAPDVLGVPPAKVKAGVQAVRDGLELGSWEEAVQVAIRNPNLLKCDPQRTVEVVGWLKHRLGLASSELEHYTMLFNKSSAVLNQVLEGLPDALGIPPADVLLLVRADPRLLLVPAATVGTGWAALKAAASMQPLWRTQVLAWTVPSLCSILNRDADRLKARQKLLAEAVPGPEHLPALSTVIISTDPAFRVVVQRVRDGTYKARLKPPAVTPASVAVVCPSLAAQL